MENPARRIEDGEEEEDRLSELPDPILHNILSLLPQMDAVKTSVLSKPWRHLWTGRSNVDFCDTSFLSALDSTLQRYYDHKLCLQQLSVRIYNPKSDSQILRKWIPRAVRGIMGVKKLDLYFVSKNQDKLNLYSRLPRQAFVSKSSPVDHLSLRGCVLSQKNPINLNHLQALVLCEVYISEQTLNNILSSDCCPLIQDVSVVRCTGFRTIKLIFNTSSNYKSPTLKHFAFEESEASVIEMDEDLPSLRSIDITGRSSLSFPRLRNNNNNNVFSSHHLTRLALSQLFVRTKLFSFNLPCLEEMKLENCYGMDELHLSSITMKLLDLTTDNSSFKATIHAPRLQRFYYNGVVPQSISFTATLPDCWEDSDLHISAYRYKDTVASLWFHKLHQLLMASSQARKISLGLAYCDYDSNRERELDDKDEGPSDIDGVVAVVGLRLLSAREVQLCNLSFSDFLKRLFRFCRPRYVGPYLLPRFRQEAEFLREKLMEERILQGCQHQVSMEALYKCGARWEPAQSSSAFCCGDQLDPVQIRFALKCGTGFH